MQNTTTHSLLKERDSVNGKVKKLNQTNKMIHFPGILACSAMKTGMN